MCPTDLLQVGLAVDQLGPAGGALQPIFITLGPERDSAAHLEYVERSQLQAALDYARESDALVVTKLDRLARSARHLSELVDLLESKRVGLRILNFGGDAVDTRSATGRLMLNMFAAMAQFEREIMLERQREGIAKAKADGKYRGRNPTARAKAEDAVQMFRAGQRAHIAKFLGIGRGSVYRALEAAGLSKGP